VNNERLIAIFFALLIIVGAWRGYQFLAHPDLGPAAEDPASVLESPRGRDENPVASPQDDAPSPGQSGSTQSADQATVRRCLENGEVVLSDKPCAPGAEVGSPTPALGRERSDRPTRSGEGNASRNRPEAEIRPH
jgi:hypothetical protein